MHILLAVIALCVAGTVYAQTTETPKRHALVVGINSYIDPKLALQYAVADARAMNDVLADHGYDVVLIPDHEASRTRLIQELTKYALIVRPDDTFALFLAGHGMRNAVIDEVYWLPYDANVTLPDINGIRLRHLFDYINDIHASRKIVILDHCYSGELTNDGGAVANGLSRNGSYGEPTTPRDAFPVADVESAITRASRGTFVVTAARGLAREDPQDGHGLMTWALLQAVRTNEADQPAIAGKPLDGALSIGELKRYLYAKVLEVSRTRGFKQQPITNLYGQDTSTVEQEWKPFLRTLSDAEKQSFSTRYQSALQVWRTSGAITELVRKSVEDALAEWVRNATTYTPQQRKIVYAVRETIDGSTLLDDEMARELSRRVNAIVSGAP